MKKIIKIRVIVLLAVSLTLVTIQSCTDLDTEVYDRAAAGKFPSNETELLSTVGGTYGQLRGWSGSVWEISEATTDEIVVPTRGPDWYDNGSWQQLARHTWNPVSPGQINGAWEWGFTVVASANIGITGLNSNPVQVQGKETILAELRVIRAFAYFWLCDLFGKVPIITESSPSGNPVQNSRQEVFNFIESEIKAALPNLTDEHSRNTLGRFNKSAANALLAKLYLNAQVYTGTPRWEDAIAACDAVINANQYTLNPIFLDNFKVNNHTSLAENIFLIPYDKLFAGGFSMQMRTLHYAQGGAYGLTQNPWNGFATRAEFYNTFSNEDQRKNMWLVGPQLDRSGNVISFVDAVDNQKKDLVFTPTISSLEKAFANEGVRSQKYEIQRDNTSSNQDNDMVIFRYADILLMKAEALVQLGKGGDALPLVNQVRARANVDPFTTVTLDDMLAERGREFAWEGWRRNDLIRFGKYNATWEFKPSSDPNRNLFPIPSQQLSNNPNLTQNTGY